MKFWSGRNCRKYRFHPLHHRITKPEDFWKSIEKKDAEARLLSIVIALLLIMVIIWGVVKCL